MTETNELATVSNEIQQFLPEGIDLGGAEDIAKAESLTTLSGFLPRLQLNNATSTLVASGNPNTAVGNFVLVWTNDNFKDLGKSVEFLSFCMRVKAMRMPDGENPISYFDKESKEFKDTIEVANLPGLNGAMYGPEFLIWIPSQETFATLYCANKTFRRMAPGIIQLMKRENRSVPAWIRLQSKFIKGPKNSWWGADVFPNQTAVPTPEMEDWGNVLKIEVEKFRNPPKSQVEAVEQSKEPERVR